MPNSPKATKQEIANIKQENEKIRSQITDLEGLLALIAPVYQYCIILYQNLADQYEHLNKILTTLNEPIFPDLRFPEKNILDFEKEFLADAGRIILHESLRSINAPEDDIEKDKAELKFIRKYLEEQKLYELHEDTVYNLVAKSQRIEKEYEGEYQKFCTERRQMITKLQRKIFTHKESKKLAKIYIIEKTNEIIKNEIENVKSRITSEDDRQLLTTLLPEKELEYDDDDAQKDADKLDG